MEESIFKKQNDHRAFGANWGGVWVREKKDE